MLAVTVLGLAVLGASASAQEQPQPGGEPLGFIGAGGKPLPFVSHDQVCEFLRLAPIKASYDIPTGTSKPRKLLLEMDGISLHAIFRTVDNKAFNVNTGASHQVMLRDSFRYEVAAYKLSRLLGLDHVPPVVLREVDGQPGSVQLWIEQAPSLADMDEQGVTPPSAGYVDLQKLQIVVFDNLVYNFDRNTGNMLVDRSGKLWFVDHTRTFTRMGVLPSAEYIVVCDRKLWQQLKAVDKVQLKQELKPYLDAGQISSLVKRQKMLIRHIEKLIKKKGESEILFDLEQYRPDPT
jgi:hypothetical protein